MTTATEASLRDAQEQAEDELYDSGADPESEADASSYPITEFDIVSSPNDFNTKTLVDFIDSDVVVIPGFQRNYVWDIKRASRLIESLVVGLPVPQVFLYERDRDEFVLIDGQQRLMSIYYFVKGRFPKREKRVDLRFSSPERSNVSADLLADDQYFSDFQLNLPESVPGQSNRLHKLRYTDLSDKDRTAFDLRTIRHIIVRQMQPENDDAMYEIFSRLNSGGVNLTPQEIRRCAYDSEFYDMLYETSVQEQWRELVGEKTPNIHMRDVEILLRGFAMLINGAEYRPSMFKFLNQFSKDAKAFEAVQLERLRQLLGSFLNSCSTLPHDAFHNAQGRFSPMLYESVFVAACERPYEEGRLIDGHISERSLSALKEDGEFNSATQSRTSHSANVAIRLDRARALLELEQVV